MNFAKFLRTPFLTEYLWWLLLIFPLLLYVYNFFSSLKYQHTKKTSIKLDCRLKVFIYVIFCFQRGFHTSFPPLIFVFKDVFLIYNLVTQKICYCEIICQSHVGCSFFYLQRRMCVNFLEYLIKFFKYKFHFHRR